MKFWTAGATERVDVNAVVTVQKRLLEKQDDTAPLESDTGTETAAVASESS